MVFSASAVQVSVCPIPHGEIRETKAYHGLEVIPGEPMLPEARKALLACRRLLLPELLDICCEFPKKVA